MPLRHCSAMTAPLTGWISSSARNSVSGSHSDGVDPVGRLVDHLDMEDQRHHQVADDHDHQIGREIVRAVVMQFLAARVAAVRDLEEGAEHVPLAAGRAFAAQAVPEVGFQGMVAHGHRDRAHAAAQINPFRRASHARESNSRRAARRRPPIRQSDQANIEWSTGPAT